MGVINRVSLFDLLTRDGLLYNERILEVDSWPDHVNLAVSLPTLSSVDEDSVGRETARLT